MLQTAVVSLLAEHARKDPIMRDRLLSIVYQSRANSTAYDIAAANSMTSEPFPVTHWHPSHYLFSQS